MIFELNSTYTIKLSTGDEIVAKVVAADSNSKYIEVDKPLTVFPTENGIQMMMTLFTANPAIPMQLNKAAIVLITPARDEVKDKYLEATTGIKPVRNKILMG